MSLPSKLASYCAAAKPILAAVARNGATGEVVIASGAGVIADPGDPVVLNDVALELMNDRSRARQFGANGRVYAEENFGERAATCHYDAWVSDLMREGATADA